MAGYHLAENQNQLWEQDCLGGDIYCEPLCEFTYLLHLALSSSGLGREPLTLETGVRFSVGSPCGLAALCKCVNMDL